MKRRSQRCTAIARDGSQCTHWSRVNRQPVLCTQHYNQANGIAPKTPVNTPRRPITLDDDLTLELLKELNKRVIDKDRYNGLLKLIELQKEKRAEEREQQSADSPFAALYAATSDQGRAWLDEMLTIYALLQARVEAGGNGHGAPMAGCDCAQCELLPWETPADAVTEPAAPRAIRLVEPADDPTEGGKYVAGGKPGLWIEVATGDEFTDEDYAEESETEK